MAPFLHGFDESQIEILSNKNKELLTKYTDNQSSSTKIGNWHQQPGQVQVLKIVEHQKEEQDKNRRMVKSR